MLKFLARCLGIVLMLCGAYICIYHFGLPKEVVDAWQSVICFIKGKTFNEYIIVALGIVALIAGFLLLMWRWRRRA